MTSTPSPSAAPAPDSPGARGLRVAVVTETFPPEINGVASTISRIVAGLREQGHRVQLVRPRQPGHDDTSLPDRDTLLLRGLPIPRYPELRMGMPATAELERAWTAQRPDVVHLVTEGPLGWSALRAARRLGLPVVSDFRTNFHAYSRHYGISWLRGPIVAYLRRFHNRTACTMVPTAGLREELAREGFERLKVVARGVDARQFSPDLRDEALRRSWGAEPDTPVALYVGRLAPEKNLDTVIDAYRAMCEVQPHTRLVLVGAGPDHARLQQLCPQAILAGSQRGEALARSYASADVFLFASMTETYGNVVPEAMASGLAVLAFDHAAAGQLIEHGRNGLLAPLDDRAVYLRLARHLASSPAQARELGAAARHTAGSLDWQHIVQAIEAEYRRAIPPHGPAETSLATPRLSTG